MQTGMFRIFEVSIGKNNSSRIPYMSSLTGTKDTDRQVLFFLNDKDLFNICSSSKYYQSLCDPQFWFDKFYQRFGVNLNNYKNIDYKDIYKRLTSLNDGESLEFAIREGYLPLVKSMIEKLSGVENIAKIIDKALKYAAGKGHLDSLKYLFDNPDKIWEDINPAIDDLFWIAAEKGNLGVVKYLAEVPENAVNIHTYEDRALGVASNAGHLDIVRYLLEFPSSARAHILKYGEYSLICAALKGYLDIVKCLIELGRVNIHSGYGLPIILADNHGYLDMVEYLIARGADYRLLNNPSDQVKEIINRHKRTGKKLINTKQCEAMTKKGTRCKTKIHEGSKYCTFHNN